jgi:hypothetical protein
MDLGTPLSRTRCALVWVLTTAFAVLLGGWLWPVVAAPEAAGFESALVRVCAWVATAVTVWLWVGATLVATDAARGRPGPRRGVPEVIRRGVLVLCGVAVTAGLATPALAAGGSAPEPGVLAGLRLPERIAVSRVPAAARPAPPPPADDHVVVRPGDSLWSIAERRLGPGATADETARAWPLLYAANREVVGPDPGLLEPGQRLVVPREGLIR